MTPTIQFKRRYRQFAPGDICATLPSGLATTLVDSHVASWYVPGAADTASEANGGGKDATAAPEAKALLRSRKDKAIRRPGRMKGARV